MQMFQYYYLFTDQKSVTEVGVRGMYVIILSFTNKVLQYTFTSLCEDV